MTQQTWLTPFIPMIEAIVGMAATALMAYLAAYLRSKWGIEIETKHQTSIQTAAKNAGALVAAGATVAEGISYVQEHVPDAVKHFDIKPRSIEEIIMAKVSQLAVPEAEVKRIVEKSPAVDTRKRPGPKPK